MSNQHSQRWKTALILLGVIALVAFIDSKFLTWLFFGVVFSVGVFETLKLLNLKASKYLVLTLSLIWLGGYFYPNPPELIFLGAIFLASVVAYSHSIDIKSIALMFYPTAGILFVWSLYLSYSMESLLWLLVIVALSDVGAYYSGKKFGKRSFCPTSPKKTIEGVIGGVALATIVGAALISSKYSFLAAIIVAFFTSISSVFGDLFESYLKREAGVKDSGDILPGHGGVLDRIDGYLFASITLYIFLKALG